MNAFCSQDFERTEFTPEVGQEELVTGLQQLGVALGDRVVVHSSLSSLGHVLGGADALIRALLSAIGPTGTLMVPYFTDYVTRRKIFNPTHPPPSEVGVVTNRLRNWPGAILSLCPSHTVVALGPDAARLVENHAFVSPVGKDSPFDRLAKIGGKVLLLGVNQCTNTTIHTGEAYASAPYWGQKRPDRPAGLWVFLPGRGKTWLPLMEAPGCSLGFERIDPYLKAHNLVTYGQIGRARCRLMGGQALIDAVVDFLHRDPGGLLCDREECFFCHWAQGFFHKDKGL